MKSVVFRFKLNWSSFLKAQFTITQHCFRYWIGVGWATSHYLHQCWPDSLTHFCGTRGRCVNSCFYNIFKDGGYPAFDNFLKIYLEWKLADAFKIYFLRQDASTTEINITIKCRIPWETMSFAFRDSRTKSHSIWMMYYTDIKRTSWCLKLLIPLLFVVTVQVSLKIFNDHLKHQSSASLSLCENSASMLFRCHYSYCWICNLV